MWSAVTKTTLQMLLWVIQAWQDCHKGPRGMQRGIFPGISIMPHIIFLLPGQSFKDCPIGDPDVAHVP